MPSKPSFSPAPEKLAGPVSPEPDGPEVALAGSSPGLGALLADMFRGWDRFWFSPGDPTNLAFIRLAAGLVILYVHLTYSWGLLSYLGPEGWVDKSVADFVRRDIPVGGQGNTWDDKFEEIARGNYYWSIFYHVTDPGWIIGLHVFFLTMMMLMTVGLWTRYTTALSWIGAMCYIQRAYTTAFGLDTMMMIVLLYLMVGPSGATLSLDRWLEVRRARKRGQAPPPVQPSVMANLATRLIQVHFCIIYFASGTSKLLGATWWSGTSLNLVMLNAGFAPMHNEAYYRTMRFLASHRWLWEIFMTCSIIATLMLEVGLPFLIWDRRWRWACICGSVMLHTGIAIFMGLTTFSLMMLCMVSSFIPPEVIRQQAAKFSERLSRVLAGKGEAANAPGELVLSR
jgi:hypothetical protein